MEQIEISGARVNNLKNISLNIPLNKLVCINGPSGSGKTSLAFHTLYAESKRRFFNSFPNSMKLFADRPTPVDVDKIYPVLPVFALPQINPVMGSRNCVVDILRVTELMQGIFYRYSVSVCPEHKVAFELFNLKDKITASVNNNERVVHLFIQKEEYLEKFKGQPFPSRCYYKNKIHDFNESFEYWEIFRTKIPINENSSKRLTEFQNLNSILLVDENGKQISKVSNSNEKSCPICQKIAPNLFTYQFNPQNAFGACKTCKGYGAVLEFDWNKIVDEKKSIKEGGAKFLNYKRFSHVHKYLLDEMKKNNFSANESLGEISDEFKTFLYDGKGKYPGFNKLFKYLESKKYKASVRIFLRGIQTEKICNECKGVRLSSYICDNTFFNKKIEDLFFMTVYEFSEFINQLKSIDVEFLKIFENIKNILNVAKEIGLGHLSLLRKIKSVSPGEYQRLLLVKYLSFQGSGTLFVFDEPSLGLDIDEQNFVLKQFRKLIKDGNSVILIEHSKNLISQSDHLITMGPLAGSAGGEIIYEGKPNIAIKKDTQVNKNKNISTDDFIVKNAEVFGKKYPGIQFSQNKIILINGKSGSGKTSLIVHGLANSILKKLSKNLISEIETKIEKFRFPENIEDVLYIDSDLTRFSSRSTVGTLTDLATPLRMHFAKLPISKNLKLEKGHFSPNSELGQCEECKGSGTKVIDMQYLEDIVIECEICSGKKLKPQIASISDGKFTISQAYNVPIHSVFKHINVTPKYKKIIEYMDVLNLNYLNLERKVQSLSGGERQRIYLLSKLVKKIEKNLIIFENISFGLSENELIKFCEFLSVLKLNSNSIIIIDQNPDLKKLVDEIVTI